MRLLIVTQYFWRHCRINDLVNGLAERGREIVVSTGYPNHPDGTVFPAFCAEPKALRTFGGARVERVPLFPRGQGGWRLALNYATVAFTAATLGAWRLATSSPAERAEMGRRGKAFSADEFDRATLIAQIEDWLRKLTAGRDRAAALP